MPNVAFTISQDGLVLTQSLFRSGGQYTRLLNEGLGVRGEATFGSRYKPAIDLSSFSFRAFFFRGFFLSQTVDNCCEAESQRTEIMLRRMLVCFLPCFRHHSQERFKWVTRTPLAIDEGGGRKHSEGDGRPLGLDKEGMCGLQGAVPVL